MHQHATLGDTVYFWFAANDTGGSGDDGANPLVDVRRGGDAANAIPQSSLAATLLTAAQYPDGCHEVAIAATGGGGYAAGYTYGVFCTLLVDGENPTGFIGSFTLDPIPSRLTPAGLQDVAQFIHRTTGTVSLLEAGVDNAKTAIEAANAGDVVLLGPGTFALGNNAITVPTGVIVIGAGIDTTVITSTQDHAVGCIVVPGDNSLIRDLTVEGIAGSQMAVGSNNDSAFVDAVLLRVKGVASRDGFYMDQAADTMSARLIDCEWHSGWDGINLVAAGADSTVHVVRNRIICESTNFTTYGIAAGDADLTVHVYDSDLHVVSDHVAGNIRGVYCALASMFVSGCRIDTDGVNPLDASRASGTLMMCGCEYDRSKTAGTITEISGLDAPLGATPTADSIMQRIQAIDVLTEAAGAGDLAAMLIAVLLLVPGAPIELTTEGENLITP